ncbi:uncharacterized protein LOC107417310 [Ziziphus jujuba]|uniref:Uncharacterized protein LOC107417310 n=1 Tax=Ziziphus jujuba TaxID=326968 RepID=A0A6P6G2L5_ZIZJJ|nr:uncharacterized protein LOC107417310 [Ziziphus jujuba]
MPSTVPLFTSFMEIMRSKKHQTQTGTGTDNSAVVKAAAWAWYQHGSGSEGKPRREYDLTSFHHAPTPSRYKLEAIRIAKEENSEDSSSISTTPTTSCTHMDNIVGSDLLDTYEIEHISKKLEGLIESSGDQNLLTMDHENIKKERKKKKKDKLIMMRGLGQAVMCRTRKEDVVESTRAAALVDGRQRPEKRIVPVVRMANRRPQATHA